MSYVPLIRKVGDKRQSAFTKYQDLFVGSRSLLELLRYELVFSALRRFLGRSESTCAARPIRGSLETAAKMFFLGAG